MKPGPIRYAWNGGNALAYQIIGEGPIDLLVYFGWMSNLDVQWESPYLARFLQRLAEHGRVIITDRRGWGCSERFSPTDVPPLETLADDLGVVLDAAESRRAVVLATAESGMVAQFFAAARADRTAGLILLDSFVSWVPRPGVPGLAEPEWWEGFFDELRVVWGVSWLSGTQPVRNDPRELEWYLRFQRSCAAPGAIIAEQRRFMETSTVGVLDAIHVPTLVLSMLFRDTNRFLAARIAGARSVTLDVERGAAGEWQHVWYEPADQIVDEVGTFLAGISDEHALLDRVLATVMFTDIVASTDSAARLGDKGWKELVERHHALVRGQLTRYRGVEVDTAGDGFFATFDGPARAVRCAQEIGRAAAGTGLDLRAGVHTGECELIDGKAGGINVIIGSRVASFADAGEVLVTRTVKDLVAGSGIVFQERGEHELKGVPDRWQLYAAT